MLSAICKNADFDFDDADEDEYDPILGIKFFASNPKGKINWVMKLTNY